MLMPVQPWQIYSQKNGFAKSVKCRRGNVSTKKWFWCKTNVIIEFWIMKNLSFTPHNAVNTHIFQFYPNRLEPRLPAAVTGSHRRVNFKLIDML